MNSLNVKIRILLLLTATIFLAFNLSTARALETWKPSASLIIDPGVFVGPIHSGMTMEEVASALGQPDKNKDSVLEYFKLGISVLPGKGQIASTVICGNARKSGPFTTAFAGHTKEGVGIGSSRDDVINAYGQPTTTTPMRGRPGTEILKYESRGINFHIIDGKVDTIAVFLKP